MSTVYVACDSYRSNILSGFVRLQEQQEFVDLTLAADGHLVKVHKNVIALASPYIKAMLQSASNQNPVIFLSNVRHNILVYLLEYIYQGEVSVPQDSLESFFNVMQSLEIAGFGKSTPLKSNQNEEISAANKKFKKPMVTLDMSCDKTDTIERPSNVAACITINSDHNLEVQQFVENVSNENDGSHTHKNNKEDQQIIINTDASQGNMLKKDNCNNGVENFCTSDMELDLDLAHGEHTLTKECTNLIPTIQNPCCTEVDSETLVVMNQPLSFEINKEASDALKIITQYSVTERGALQIIVSRYIYCCHHSSKGGRAHRWRCADYRKLRCPAYIDSLDNRIVLRKGIHKHGFHDDKIYIKNKRGLIFHSYKQAKKATELPKKISSSDDHDKTKEATELPRTNISYYVDDVENAIQVLSKVAFQNK